MNGKLIVIEGLDGSGKHTQAELLNKYFVNNSLKSQLISFPDYSEPSSALIKMYLNSEFGSSPADVNAYAASSFFAVDRFASFKKNWGKDYLDGNMIICDRYTTSNAFYQIAKLPEEQWEKYLTWLYDYEYNKLELPRPSAVIYLSVPVEISQNLITQRYHGNNNKKDIHESSIEFLKKCELAAKKLIQKDGWITIDCTQTGKIKNKHQIHEEIITSLKGDVLNELKVQGTRY